MTKLLLACPSPARRMTITSLLDRERHATAAGKPSSLALTRACAWTSTLPESMPASFAYSPGSSSRL
eukprot:scaffold1866_cov277-Pinguiococcus_pyrenoidosus.AAC.12